jgi:tetratricopeptide (TPR) repeat protein
VAEEDLKGDTGRDEDDFSNAGIAASMGRWDKALESYDDIISRNQSNWQAWQGRADALWQMDRYNESVDSYEKALELDPGNAILREQLDEARKTAHK